MLIALLTGLSGLTGCGGTEIDPPAPAKDLSAPRADGAADVLARLGSAIADQDAEAAGSLATTASRDRVEALVENADVLRLSDVGFRFVAEDPAGAGAGAEAGSPGGWVASVTATWRLPEDGTAVSIPTRFVFTGSGRSTRLVSSSAVSDETTGGTSAGRSALWLEGGVSVVRTGRTLVQVAEGSGGDAAARAKAVGLSKEAVRAVSDVRRVLPAFDGPLVVEAPSSESELEQVLGVEPGTYRAIAAVTTTVTGTRERGTPVHVYLNPAVFNPLGPKGSQVVLSHESTHVATLASFADLPTWLLEGFADYVALAHADVPFATAARQVLARVRADGPPTALPTAAQLSPSATGLGATYEEAWTACRFLAEEYGEQRLVRFYDSVDDGSTVPQAFGALGTSERAFVRAWSADLARRAGR